MPSPEEINSCILGLERQIAKDWLIEHIGYWEQDKEEFFRLLDLLNRKDKP